MIKSVKKRKNIMKHSKKKKFNHNKYNIKTMKIIGGGKEIQDRYIEDTFKKIKDMKIEFLIENLKDLCVEFNNNIVNAKNFDFTFNIRSYLVINMLRPFILEYVYSEENTILDKLDMLDRLTSNSVFLGSEIKKHNLLSLSSYQKKSNELLKSCKDDEYYCVMNPKYIILDYRHRDLVNYYCDSDNSKEIIRITKNEDLQKVKNGSYLYSTLPNMTLCLFQGQHSAGSCGQPVICAGLILIEEHKIKKIDNSSGHYSPPYYMLTKALDIFQKQGLIISNEVEDNSTVICECSFEYLKNTAPNSRSKTPEKKLKKITFPVPTRPPPPPIQLPIQPPPTVTTNKTNRKTPPPPIRPTRRTHSDSPPF